MTPQPTLEEIVTKLENAVQRDIQLRLTQHRSGRSPKSTHAEAIAAIRAWAVSQLPEKKNPKNFSQVKLYTGADLADVHNETVDQATQSLMGANPNSKEAQSNE